MSVPTISNFGFTCASCLSCGACIVKGIAAFALASAVTGLSLAGIN